MMQLALPFTKPPVSDGLALPAGFPAWLAAFVQHAVEENRTLAANAAHHAVAARVALLTALIDAAKDYLDTEIGIEEAAAVTGRHPETIRRAVRSGTLTDRRANPRGHHLLRRGDLDMLARPRRRPYDALADAQDIATRRSPL